MDTRQALLATYTFDRAREAERKRAVERLFGRTPAQLAEEEALYVEIRRLEQNETRFAAEREDLLKLLGGWERTPNGDRNSTASVGAGLGFAIPGSVPAPEEPSDGKVSIDLSLIVDDCSSPPFFLQRKKRKANDGDDEAGPSKTQLTYKQKTELKQQAFGESLGALSRSHGFSHLRSRQTTCTASRASTPCQRRRTRRLTRISSASLRLNQR
jgi:DNA methyltransferase 1-associated protein 1